MAAMSLVHHTSQSQPPSADYKLHRRLQIMTKDVLASLKDEEGSTTCACKYAHTHTHALFQFINMLFININK